MTANNDTRDSGQESTDTNDQEPAYAERERQALRAVLVERIERHEEELAEFFFKFLAELGEGQYPDEHEVEKFSEEVRRLNQTMVILRSLHEERPEE